MSLPIFPATLPAPSGYGMKPGLQLALSDGEDLGPVSSRRRFRQPTALSQVTFTFLNDDYDIFVDFWKVTLLNGFKRFALKLPSAAGMVYHVVRFIKPYRSNKKGYRYTEVTGELEIRDRAFTGSTLVPREVAIDLPCPTHTIAAFNYVNSYHFATDPTITWRISLPAGRRFQAWSGYPSDASAISGGVPTVGGVPLRWINKLDIRSGSGGSFVDSHLGGQDIANVGIDPESSRIKFVPGNISGYADYWFWMSDPNPADDPGGLSLLLTEVL